MLEDILKSINLNLEKIAKSLENKSNDFFYNAQQKGNLEGAQTVTENSQEQTVTSYQDQIPVLKDTQQNDITIPVTQESFTQEQLAVAMSNAISQGKSDIIMSVLQSFGVQALTQIKTEDYNKLALTLREKGITV